MNSETEETRVEEDEDLDDFEDDDLEDTAVVRTAAESDDDDDDVADTSAEINVEKLIADFEKSDAEIAARKKEIRRRLEELAEAKSLSLDDTFAIDFDDD